MGATRWEAQLDWTEPLRWKGSTHNLEQQPDGSGNQQTYDL